MTHHTAALMARAAHAFRVLGALATQEALWTARVARGHRRAADQGREWSPSTPARWPALRLLWEGASSVRCWESYREEVPANYVRANGEVHHLRTGGLAWWNQGGAEPAPKERGPADVELDREIAERFAHASAIDEWLGLRTRPGVDGELRFTETSQPVLRALKDGEHIDISLVGGLAVTMYDQARRLAERPDLCIGQYGRWQEKRAPFASLAAALAFFRDGGDRELGTGSVNLVVAEDRDEDRAMRAAMVRNGRLTRDASGHRPAGYLPFALLHVKPSRSGSTGGAKGAHSIELHADVVAAIRASGVDPERLAQLCELHIGTWEERAAKARLGAEKEKNERGARQRTLVRFTLAEMAVRWCEPKEALQAGMKTARKLVLVELQRRGLLPPVEPRREEPRRHARIAGPPMPGMVGA